MHLSRCSLLGVGHLFGLLQLESQALVDAIQIQQMPPAAEHRTEFFQASEQRLQLRRRQILQALVLQVSRINLIEDLGKILGLALELLPQIVQCLLDGNAVLTFDHDNHIGHLTKVFGEGHPTLVIGSVGIDQVRAFGLKAQVMGRVHAAQAAHDRREQQNGQREMGRQMGDGAQGPRDPRTVLGDT